MAYVTIDQKAFYSIPRACWGLSLSDTQIPGLDIVLSAGYCYFQSMLVIPEEQRADAPADRMDVVTKNPVPF